jgi:vanillate O-demethylase ferredoxin subunit
MDNPLPWLDATIADIRDLTPTVREFTLRPTVPAAAWTVGSHLKVRIAPAQAESGDELRHYSLIGVPQRGAPWRIAVKRVEPSRGGSAWMWSLRVGEELQVQGPRNHFELPLAAPQTLVVAGGIGITPLVGMALTLAARRADVRMLYAARNDAEFAYVDELRAALGERLTTFSSARGQHIDLDAAIAALRPDAQLLICGPHGLLHAVQEAWARAGRHAALLRFENFGSGGDTPAEPFWVELPRHGLRFEVDANTTLLEALEAHGVAMLSDCLRGECGLCTVDVLKVEGRIDHRDLFLDAAERRSGHRLCSCVSRVCGGGVVLDSAYRPEQPQNASPRTETVP